MWALCPYKCFQYTEDLGFIIYIPVCDQLCQFTMHPIHCQKDQFTVVRTKPVHLNLPLLPTSRELWFGMLPIQDADAFGGVATKQPLLCHEMSHQNGSKWWFWSCKTLKIQCDFKTRRLWFQFPTWCCLFQFVCPKLGYPIFTEVHAFACRACASMTLKPLKASRAAKSLAEFVTCSDSDFRTFGLFHVFWRMWPQQSESDSSQTGLPEFLCVANYFTECEVPFEPNFLEAWNLTLRNLGTPQISMVCFKHFILEELPSLRSSPCVLATAPYTPMPCAFVRRHGEVQWLVQMCERGAQVTWQVGYGGMGGSGMMDRGVTFRKWDVVCDGSFGMKKSNPRGGPNEKLTFGQTGSCKQTEALTQLAFTWRSS